MHLVLINQRNLHLAVISDVYVTTWFAVLPSLWLSHSFSGQDVQHTGRVCGLELFAILKKANIYPKGG